VNPALAEKQEIKGLGHNMTLVTSEKGRDMIERQ